jgi:C-terminal processing protease CtpA/Prc
MLARPPRRLVALLAAAALAAPALAAPGRLGFAIEAETDGLFSTTLKRLTITSVVDGAPAQQAGLQARDEVETVNGVTVAGAPGGRIRDLVGAIRPGDHLRLKVRRADGEHVIDIVAGERPAE